MRRKSLGRDGQDIKEKRCPGDTGGQLRENFGTSRISPHGIDDQNPGRTYEFLAGMDRA
jgi:hypothetical protein